MNKKLKIKLDRVKTISNNQVLKTDCILINKEYYEKEKDCFLINYKGVEKWIPYDNSYCLNFLTNEYEKVKDLENQNLSKFIIGFHNNNPIFGYDVYNYVTNVPVLSHSSNRSKDYEIYLKELRYSKDRILKYENKLEPEQLFNTGYTYYISCLCKINYYRTYINTEFVLDDKINLHTFHKILQKVDNYINRDSDINRHYTIFNQDYLQYVSINYSNISNEEDPENTLIKITYTVARDNPILSLLFDLYLKEYQVTNSIENSISLEKEKIKRYEQNIEDIKNNGFFHENCRNKVDAINLGFIESFYDDSYYLERNLTSDEKRKIKQQPIHNEQGSYSKNIKINYNVNPETDVFARISHGYYENADFKITKDSYQIAKLLKGLTFGLELETTGGRLREQDLYKFGVIPLRDGSVPGFEYTSIPYGFDDASLNSTSTKSLSRDLLNMKELTSELSKRCSIGAGCSMHIHIGNARKDKPYLIALYMLCYMIQDEMFEMFPKFKENSPKYLGTQKNYCAKLQHLDLFKNCIFDKSTVLQESYCNNVNQYFNNIFRFLSDGHEIGSKFNRKNCVHPHERKWERHGRYHWINLVNSVFSNSRTIEFRLHTATLNFTKILNWILICSAIVKYADTHVKEIISGKLQNITLNDILIGYSNNFRDKKKVNENGLFIHSYLNAYIEERKQYFKIQTKKENFICQEELTDDSKYVFTYNNIKEIM